MKLSLPCLLSVVLGTALPAQANLTVHPMRVSVDARRGAQIRVYSQSTQTQYVQVDLRHIVDPAGSDEREMAVEPEDAAIAVTPRRFALAAGGNRLIRIVPLQPVGEETAYRIYFEGVQGEDDARPMASTPGVDAKIGVRLVWGALVNVLPPEGTVDVQVRGGALHNAGSLRVGIIGIDACDGSRCTGHPLAHSLYPGGTLGLPFPLQAGGTLQLHYRLSRDGYREHVQTLVP